MKGFEADSELKFSMYFLWGLDLRLFEANGRQFSCADFPFWCLALKKRKKNKHWIDAFHLCSVRGSCSGSSPEKTGKWSVDSGKCVWLLKVWLFDTTARQGSIIKTQKYSIVCRQDSGFKFPLPLLESTCHINGCTIKREHEFCIIQWMSSWSVRVVH